jgi:glutamyl endopeptidase
LKTATIVVASALLGAVPPVAYCEQRNPHTSISNIATVLTIRASPAPEVELPFNGSISDSVVGSIDSRSVVDPSVFPFRAVVRILADGTSCSGWLYGEDVVATAGHCIHKRGRWAQSVTVQTGGLPAKVCRARTLFTTVGWTQGDERYDYGAIKLDCIMGTTTGWLGYGWGHDLRVNNTRVSVVGYGAETAGGPKLQASLEPVDALVDGQLFYSNDTGDGTSGAPVIASSLCGACAVAVHAKPLHNGPPPHNKSNHGTLISREVFENLRAWKELR